MDILTNPALIIAVISLIIFLVVAFLIYRKTQTIDEKIVELDNILKAKVKVVGDLDLQIEHIENSRVNTTRQFMYYGESIDNLQKTIEDQQNFIDAIINELKDSGIQIKMPPRMTRRVNDRMQVSNNVANQQYATPNMQQPVHQYQANQQYAIPNMQQQVQQYPNNQQYVMPNVQQPVQQYNNVYPVRDDRRGREVPARINYARQDNNEQVEIIDHRRREKNDKNDDLGIDD